ncbi:MAG: glycosyltransferase family 87 protein [Gemmatimonadales bacterium]
MKLPKSSLAVLILAPLVVVGLTLSYSHRAGDFAGYLAVGDLGLQGRDIYRDATPGTNTWPPLFGLACIPLALLSHLSLTGARTIWLLINWGALAFVLALCVRLVYDRPLGIRGLGAADDHRVDAASGAALVPLLICALWVLSNFEHLQVNILIFTLALAGLAQHRKGRDGAGGALIGLAAALKVMPVLFVPYFIWRRRWRAAASTALATVAWSLVPLAVYGPTKFLDQLRAWRDALSAGWPVGKMNLSVYAMVDRTVGHGIVPFSVAGFDALTPSGAPAVRWLVLGLLAIVTLLACLLFRGRYDPRARRTVAEWSVVFLVGALFGTVTWKAYLVVLLLPMILFVATWRDPAVIPAFRQRLRMLCWVSFALGMATATDLVGRSLAGRLEMGSLQTWMALLVLGTTLWYRDRIDVNSSA